MQLGMIGLGRMGANMVRRLMRRRPRLRRLRRRRRRRDGDWPSEGAIGSRGPRRLRRQARARRATSGSWCRPRSSTRPSTTWPSAARRRRHASSTAATATTATTSAGPSGARGRGHPLRRRRHARRRVRPRPGLLPDDRRRGRGRRPAATRSSRRSPPGSTPHRARRAARATPSRPSTGYCTAGPNGAGHFVKMVHNGIEYGLMAAYAEGLNILERRQHRAARAREGRRDRAAAHPEYYQYDLDIPPIAEVWRRGIAWWLVAARPHRRRARRVARPRRVHRAGVRLGRGPLDGAGRGREGVPAHVLTSALFDRFASPGRRRLRRQAAVGDAQAVRRPRREAQRRGHEAE